MDKELKLHQVVIALGTNLGDKESNLKNAISQIKSKVGEVPKVSSIYKTFFHLPFLKRKKYKKQVIKA
jgi:7,8-dihydro-6-hydroxymethylpterin-pyrophosphokinase